MIVSAFLNGLRGCLMNTRVDVVEISTSKFLELYEENYSQWFCFVLRDYIRDGDRWWHLNGLNVERYWTKSNSIVHGAFHRAYPEVFLGREHAGHSVMGWVNLSNKAVGGFLRENHNKGSATYRTQLLKMLISEYGDRILRFEVRGAK